MALPIIIEKRVEPPEIHECETATITIIARDPTGREVPLKISVANGQGEVTPDTVTVRIAGGGPLMYEVTFKELGPNQGEIIPDPVRPNVFTYFAPCPNDPNHDPTTHVTLPAPHTH